jgi:tetratricopeptide (TPR) repeat protein
VRTLLTHWIAVTLVSAGLLSRDTRGAAQSVQPETAPSAGISVDLVEVPQPDLSSVDPPVREQVQAAQAALAAVMARADPSTSQRGQAFGSLAQIYQTYEFDDAALAAYENAARLQPQAFRWPYYEGYLHQRIGDTENAARDYKRALALRPGDTSAMIRLGNAELSLNEPDSAKSWFTKAISRSPSAAALMGLGKAALLERRYPDALKYFQQALAREPQASSIHYQLAMAYRGMGDLQHSQEQMQLRGPVELAIQDPLLDEIRDLKQGKVGLLERAAKAVRERRFKDAVISYRRMVELYPTDAIAHTYLGVALAKSGQNREALEQYTQALQLNPNNPTTHYNLGVLLFGTGKEDLAIAQFQETLQLDPGLVAAHFQLANLLMRRGDDDAAGQEYGKVVSLEPQNAFARLMQAMAAVHLDAYSQARSLLEEASLALPKDPDIANALARVLAAAPDSEVRDQNRALVIIQRLLESQQGDGLEEGITLAMAQAGAGHFKEAAECQRALIASLRNSGRLQIARALRQNLDLYEHGKPCFKPWARNDPVFTPVPRN